MKRNQSLLKKTNKKKNTQLFSVRFISLKQHRSGFAHLVTLGILRGSGQEGDLWVRSSSSPPWERPQIAFSLSTERVYVLTQHRQC